MFYCLITWILGSTQGTLAIDPSWSICTNVNPRLTARAASESAAWRAAFLGQQANWLARMERWVAREADLLFTVSADERAYFSQMSRTNRVVVIPNGADTGQLCSLPVGRMSAPPRIMFLGTMSWSPNVEAARYLARDAAGGCTTWSALSYTSLGVIPPPTCTGLERNPRRGGDRTCAQYRTLSL